MMFSGLMSRCTSPAASSFVSWVAELEVGSMLCLLLGAWNYLYRFVVVVVSFILLWFLWLIDASIKTVIAHIGWWTLAYVFSIFLSPLSGAKTLCHGLNGTELKLEKG